MNIDEALEVLAKVKGIKIVSEARIPKYRSNRTAAIVYAFDEAGIDGDEYVREIQRQFREYENPRVETSGEFVDKYSYQNVLEFVIRPERKSVSAGEMTGHVKVEGHFATARLVLSSYISEKMEGEYYNLFRDRRDIPISSNPSEDFAKCVQYVDEIIDKMDSEA